MAIRKRKKPDLVLPLSSMGDIAFLLIIFFMLASNFMKQANVEMEKAASSDVDQQEPPKVSVTMDNAGVIWYEGQQCNPEMVKSALLMLAENDKDLKVHVAIDKTITREKFMPLFEALSEAQAKIILTGDKED